MIGRMAFLTAMVAAPSTFAIGYWQAQHQEPAVVSAVQINAPVIARPGSGAAGAARYFAGLNAPPPPPAPPPVVSSTPPGPPPIDVAVLFRREVSAVLTQGEPHVVLASGRKIAKGEVYSDGWRVSNLNAQTAVLTKGRETRTVNLFSAPPAAANAQVASAAPIFTGPLGLTNGMTLEQRIQQIRNLPQQQQRAALQQLLQSAGPNAMQQITQAMRGGQNNQAGRGGQGGQTTQGFGGRGGQGGGGRGAQGGNFGGANFGATGGFNGGFAAGSGRRGATQQQVTVVAQPAPRAEAAAADD